MPTVARILESALYVDDMERVVAFYRDVLGFAVLDAGTRLVAMDAGGSTVLLIFKRGATTQGAHTPGAGSRRTTVADPFTWHSPCQMKNCRPGRNV
jgi:catechol-2,3-dioxygenase